MADGPVVNGGTLLGNQPPKQGFEQTILRDLGDLGRAGGRFLGLNSAPIPPRTPAETPGPPVGVAAGAAAAAAASPAPIPADVIAASAPTPEQLGLSQAQLDAKITPTWDADP